MESYKKVKVKTLDEIEETFTNMEVVGDKIFGSYANKMIDVSSALVDICEDTIEVKETCKMSHGFFYSYLHPITNSCIRSPKSKYDCNL